MENISSSINIIPDETKNVNIQLGKDQELSIRSKTYIKKPSYIMVASGYGAKTMNYTKELLAMTPQEAFVFDILMDNRDTPDPTKEYIRSNYSFINNKDLTKSEKKKVYEGYKRLHAKDLVIRVARGRYLINPRLVITSDDLYHKELIAYTEITTGSKLVKPDTDVSYSFTQLTKDNNMKITAATKQKWAKEASSTKFEGYDEPFKDLNKILEATGAYCMFKFKDGKRGKDTLIGGTKFLALDIDDSTITDKECHFLLGDINHHIARTSDPDNAFKFRLLVELDAVVDISDAQWKIFLQLVGEELGLSLDLLPKSQLFFAYGAEEVLSVTDEEPLQTRELIMKSAEYITNKPTKPKLSKQAKLDALSDRRETFSYAYEALNGKGSKFLVRAGLQALELGASIEEVEELIYDINDYWTVSMDNDRIEDTVLSYLRRKAL